MARKHRIRSTPVALVATLVVVATASACASVLGIKDVSDDPVSGDDGGINFDSSDPPPFDAGRDIKNGGDAPACGDANLRSDPMHCGTCGHVCGTTNASVSCVGGVCVFACQPSYAHCGTDDSTGCSVALGADQQHCGACDHSCLGTSCTSGICAATPLATSQSASLALTLDDQFVYWTSEGSTTAMPYMSDGSVQRIAKVDAGAPTVIAPAQAGARGIAVDATNVYWTTQSPLGVVATTAKTGGPIIPIAAGQDYPFAVAVDAQNYYWVDGANDLTQPAGSVWMLSRSGGKAVPIAQSQYVPVNLAVGGGYVYWVDDAVTPNGGVLRAPLDGGAVTPLAEADDPVSVVLTDAGLFWANSQPTDGGTVEVIPPSGGAPVTLVANLYNPAWMAVDGAHAYWTDYGGGTVWRVGLNGSNPLIIAVGQLHPVGIAVDDQYVYWTNGGSLNTTTMFFDNEDGAVMKVAK